ncbi:putative myelin-associated glycoprotein-like [Scophthalmus maximus]|uniref:Putative myelin-associated glycoprotein-like n=1 Tax=Scophthalmus maximus TaxID=52904 RepID=A0A2U9CYB8_SCOMX|nr:putative myelin-associated glycoprotein-like [Scophthalmus maximus]
MVVGLTDVGLLIAVMQGVFSRTWKITLPRSIESLGNSCVTVPCRFEVPGNQEANVLNCSDSGVWRRGSLSGPIVLNSLNPSANVLQGQVVGDLKRKNCTTMIHRFSKSDNDVYFFRLDCPNLKFTFSDGVLITAQTEPPPPQLTFVDQLPEGDQVRMQCSAPVSCSTLPPSLTWSPQDSSRREESQMLQVSVCRPTDAPRFTTATINTSGPVSERETVTFACSSDANPPVRRYSWFRGDRGKLTRIGQGATLVLQVNPKDSGEYLCEAQSLRGSQRSRPVFLEVTAIQATGSSEGSVMIPYIICGAVLLLYVLTVAVDLYKYQSLSKRLKKIEQKGEHTYIDLQTFSLTSDYDHLKFKPKPPPEDADYENSIAMETTVKNQPQPNRT